MVPSPVGEFPRAAGADPVGVAPPPVDGETRVVVEIEVEVVLGPAPEAHGVHAAGGGGRGPLPEGNGEVAGEVGGGIGDRQRIVDAVE